MRIQIPGGIKTLFQKYKYAALVLLLGVVLLAVPSGREDKSAAPVADLQVAAQPTVEEKLEALLRQVDGAGRVSVMLTVVEGEYTVLQTDSITENRSSGDSEEETLRTETVFLDGGSAGSEAIPVQIRGPVYRGAVVLAEGADQASVRLDLVSAVMSLTGLKADKITVIKMKSN